MTASSAVLLAAVDLLAATPAALSDVRSAASDSSLFLLVGGLVMLTLICVLVLVQNLLPERAVPAGDRPLGRRLRSLDGGPLAQDLARRNDRARRPVATRLAPVDLALDRLVELHVGEPRLLLAHERTSRVRLYGCRGCLYGSGNNAAPGHGCGRERAALEEVFGAVYGSAVKARESACRRRGDAACEFEVAH